MLSVQSALSATANGKLGAYGAPPLSVVPSEQLRLQPTSPGYEPSEQVITEETDSAAGGEDSGNGGDDGDGGDSGDPGGGAEGGRSGGREGGGGENGAQQPAQSQPNSSSSLQRSMP